MSKLNETAADVAALIPRYSWEIMDEEQRDELMETIILPRYMKTTADGTKLTPTWWGETVGATAEAIRGRVKRLRASQKPDGASRSRHTKINRTAGALREADPEQVRHIVSELPGDAVQQLVEVATDVSVERARAFKSERQDEPTVQQLTAGEKFDPSAEWIDAHVTRVWSRAHDLRHHADKHGVLIRSMSHEEALEHLLQAESDIAEVRAAVQEQIQDNKAAEVVS